uniref:Uncharacterized protein n=1 Tax=Romanomermis culicivorax TaxID=13658 RepID=A0A915L5T8_ROMCU
MGAKLRNILGAKVRQASKKYAQDSTFTQTALLDSLPYVTGQLTTGLRYKTGFKLADLLVKCTFGGLACDMGRDFNVWNNLAVGNCFTYNHWNSTNLKWGRRPGRSSVRLKGFKLLSAMKNVRSASLLNI